jgi:hypothetical protein
MKPFDINDIRAAYPEYETTGDDEYIDWTFCKWGDPAAPKELEPLLARITIATHSKKVSVVVTALDEGGNTLDLPPGANTWAAQQVKELVDGLLKYEEVTLTETLEKLLKGE